MTNPSGISIKKKEKNLIPYQFTVQTSSRSGVPVMTLSVADSFLYQEVSDSLYLNADETAMGASKRHADPDGK